MKKQNVEFKVGKEILRGSLFMPEGEGPFPGVIFFHGSGSNGDTYYEASQRLAEKGIFTFMFNFRGCGKSDGNFSDQTIGMGLEDAEAALSYFLSLSKIDKNRIGLVGSSFGGFLAVLISSNFDFKSIILIVPAAYSPKKMNTLHSDDLDELRKDFNLSESYLKIRNFDNNLLIIQSEKDDILPEGMVEKYVAEGVNASKFEHLVLKGAGHRIKLFPKSKHILLEKLDNWFLDTL